MSKYSSAARASRRYKLRAHQPVRPCPSLPPPSSSSRWPPLTLFLLHRLSFLLLDRARSSFFASIPTPRDPIFAIPRSPLPPNSRFPPPPCSVGPRAGRPLPEPSLALPQRLRPAIRTYVHLLSWATPSGPPCVLISPRCARRLCLWWAVAPPVLASEALGRQHTDPPNSPSLSCHFDRRTTLRSESVGLHRCRIIPQAEILPRRRSADPLPSLGPEPPSPVPRPSSGGEGANIPDTASAQHPGIVCNGRSSNARRKRCAGPATSRTA